MSDHKKAAVKQAAMQFVNHPFAGLLIEVDHHVSAKY
jgi:hypothetical protein